MGTQNKLNFWRVKVTIIQNAIFQNWVVRIIWNFYTKLLIHLGLQKSDWKQYFQKKFFWRMSSLKPLCLSIIFFDKIHMNSDCKLLSDIGKTLHSSFLVSALTFSCNRDLEIWIWCGSKYAIPANGDHPSWHVRLLHADLALPEH